VIVFRQATQADAPAILALLEEIMRHHGVVPPDLSRLAATVDSIIAAPDHCFLVAASEGAGPTRHLVGMCALVFSISTWSASPVCELQDVVVTEDHRRAEVGRGLIAAAEEIARARGCSRLFLLAESWNLGAHSFYRSLGLNEKTCLYFERDLSASRTT
jgi:N-acetylglutamate synthase-like GNAT family acetyltransferase